MIESLLRLLLDYSKFNEALMKFNEVLMKSDEAAEEVRDKSGIIVDKDTAHIINLMT